MKKQAAFPDRLLFFAVTVFAVFVNLQEFFVTVLNFPAWISQVDEVVALLAYPVSFFALRKQKQWWILVVLLLPVASMGYSAIASLYVAEGVNWVAVVVQSFINFKFFLYFLLFYSLWLRKSEVFEPTFRVCLFVSLVGLLVNAFLPSYFVYSDAEYVSERQRLIGFQYKPNDLALFLSFYFTYLVVALHSGWRKVLYCTFVAAVIFVSTSRSALFVCAISVVFHLWATRRLGGVLLIGVFALPVLVLSIDLSNSFFVSETVSNFSEFSVIESSEYIRFIMLYYGFVLAVQYFPFGVGAGGFGTVMSSDSPIYAMLGLSRIRFFEEMVGVFDSNIASIMGEYGFLGVALFALLLIRMIRRINSLGPSDVYLFIFIIIFIAFFQPMFSYQVNSINVLLLIFSVAVRRGNRYSKLRQES